MRDRRQPIPWSDGQSDVWNPYATPGLDPGDESAFSLSGEFGRRGVFFRGLARRRWGRRLVLAFLAVYLLLIGIIAVAHL